MYSFIIIHCSQSSSGNWIRFLLRKRDCNFRREESTSRARFQIKLTRQYFLQQVSRYKYSKRKLKKRANRSLFYTRVSSPGVSLTDERHIHLHLSRLPILSKGRKVFFSSFVWHPLLVHRVSFLCLVTKKRTEEEIFSGPLVWWWKNGLALDYFLIHPLMSWETKASQKHFETLHLNFHTVINTTLKVCCLMKRKIARLGFRNKQKSKAYRRPLDPSNFQFWQSIFIYCQNYRKRVIRELLVFFCVRQKEEKENIDRQFMYS